MTNLFSTISGQFTRNLILGYFLPVMVFVALGVILGAPIFPADWPLLRGFLGFRIESKRACQLMSAFDNEVQAQRGKAITEGQATHMTSVASQTRTALGC